MKYLGLIIDGTWNFSPHVDYAANKAAKVMRTLGRLMSNLRGPTENKRRLYSHVVMATLLYGIPIEHMA